MNVLIAGGGTGGHLFPGIALAEEVRRRFPKSRIIFVGTARGIEVRAVPKAGFELFLLPVSGLRKVGIVQFIKGVLKLPLAVLAAFRVVSRFAPDVAVSVGGYAAGPAVLASRLLGVPCVVMEQNAVMGFTNRILSRFSKRVYAALPVTGVADDLLMLAGNPVRASFQAIRENPYQPAKPLRLLAFGGSQGARALNDAMLELLPRLVESGLDISILHQCGRPDQERVVAAYAKYKELNARVEPFIDEMAEAYAEADLIISRSGATTIAEVTVCGRPAILVPFPHAVDDHQSKNARALEKLGGAVCLPQPELSGDKLMSLIAGFVEQPEQLKKMAECSLKAGHPEAAATIATDLEILCGKGGGRKDV